MAVRRLAPEAVQPESVFSFHPRDRGVDEGTRRQIPASAGRPQGRVGSPRFCGASRPIAAGGCRKRRFEAVSERLEMPYIRVYEVATFYTMFNSRTRRQVLRSDVRHHALHAARLETKIRKVLEERIGAQQTVLRGRAVLLARGGVPSAPAATRRWVQINDDYYGGI